MDVMAEPFKIEFATRFVLQTNLKLYFFNGLYNRIA